MAGVGPLGDRGAVKDERTGVLRGGGRLDLGAVIDLHPDVLDELSHREIERHVLHARGLPHHALKALILVLGGIDEARIAQVRVVADQDVDRLAGKDRHADVGREGRKLHADPQRLGIRAEGKAAARATEPHARPGAKDAAVAVGDLLGETAQNALLLKVRNAEDAEGGIEIGITLHALTSFIK